MIASFDIAPLPRIRFGAGTAASLPELVVPFGRRILLATGEHSLRASSAWPLIESGLREAGIDWVDWRVGGEPSPELVDEAVQRFADESIEAVVAIGGGSVLDAAKAVAGLLRVGDSVMDYLEGVGPEKPYRGPATPFIAVPTTAGTGSEATKNAVLSHRGPQGFKKSFRDERLVAQWALVDPDLLASCPPELVAADGMDALTQLLESYVSLRANPLTDALALRGLALVRDGLLPLHASREDADARSAMALASLLSGITLAQVGLGSVHGLAAPLGAFFPIPHGAACGTLVGAATAVNIEAMRSREPDNPALGRYAEAAQVLCGRSFERREDAWEALVSLLDDWSARLGLPTLDAWGVTEADFPHIVANSRGSSMKTNPIVLTDAEIAEILARRTRPGSGKS